MATCGEGETFRCTVLPVSKRQKRLSMARASKPTGLDTSSPPAKHFGKGVDVSEGETMIRPGQNIAIKVPAYRYDDTVAFYRDRVGLEVARTMENSVGFHFGELTLWIDRVLHQSQVDVWLELFSDDPTQALAQLGSPQRDDLEPLDSVIGHWTSDPAGTVLLIRKEK